MSDTELEELKILMEEWKTVIQTQMHFNDMIMMMRTTGVSVVLAVFGAAAYSLQYDKLYLEIGVIKFHAAVPIILFGLGMLCGIFFLDYFYYYKMLLGAVERGYQIDDAFKNKKIADTQIFGITKLISDSIGKPGRSKIFIGIFYGIIFILGIVFVLSVYYGYIPKVGQ